MSAPGHCRHCHHLCPGGDEEYVGNGAYVREHCSVDDEAQWSDGHCPACDEAEGLPDDWTPNALSHAKDLARRSGEHAKIEAAGNVVWLDRTLRDGLDAIAPWVREFYGSIRGQLTGVNVTRGNRASLRPHEGGRVVHIGFPNALAEDMRDGLLEFVEVEGMVRQNDDGRIYYVTAEQVRLVETPTMSWRDLRGAMPEITGGQTVAEYLEGVHGDE